MNNSTVEFRHQGASGWGVQLADQEQEQDGQLVGILSKTSPRVFGRGGRYSWPLQAKLLEKDSSFPEQVEIQGVGKCTSVVYSGAVDEELASTRLFVEYALATENKFSGMCLWRVWLTGLADTVTLSHIELFNGTISVHGPSPNAPKKLANRSVFVNGWQSWTFSGALRCGETQPHAFPNIMNMGFHNKMSGGPMAKLRKDMKYECDFFTCVSEHPLVGSCSNSCTSSCTPQLRSAVLLGWLSQRENFGVIRLDETGGCKRTTMVAECDDQVLTPNDADADHRSFVTDWAVVNIMSSRTGDSMVSMDSYMDAVGKQLDARSITSSNTFNGEVPVGWCSWYHFYEKISQEKLVNNCDILSAQDPSLSAPGPASSPKLSLLKQEPHLGDSLPTNLFLIDDGYTRPATWGDWTNQGVDKTRFPNGMQPVMDHIRKSGKVPGIWMAPFAADKKSVVFQKHKDWAMRVKRYDGKPGSSKSSACNSGRPGKFFRGLDATHPQVQEHVSQSITTAVKDWGVRFLKLDFLYACILRDYSGKNSPNNRYDQSTTRAQAFNLGLRTIREAAGDDLFILGCGCPIAPAIGWADAMRVSADTGPTWFPKFLNGDKNNFPSGVNMVRNSLARIGMHNRWWLNDPDCITLRESTSLTTDEIKGIATTVALTGGLLLLSDDLKAVSEARITIGEALFPPTGEAAVAHDVLYREMPEVLSMGFEEAHDEAHDNAKSWKLVAVANWVGKTKKVHTVARELVHVPSKTDLDLFEFWTGTYRRVARTIRNLSFSNIPVHSAHIYAIRAGNNTDNCAYVGSDLHFSMGKELKSFVDHTVTSGEPKLEVEFELPRLVRNGHVWIRLPCAKNTKVRAWLGTKEDERESALKCIHIHEQEDHSFSVWKVPVRIALLLPSGKDNKRVFSSKLTMFWGPDASP